MVLKFYLLQAKPIGEKVKENVKTTSYLGVIVIGVGVTAIMFYSIFSELFSSNSPQASECFTNNALCHC
jgi:uncharacterized membrane protein (DUF373 family)